MSGWARAAERRLPGVLLLPLALALAAVPQAPPVAKVSFALSFAASVPVFETVTIASDGAARFEAKQNSPDAPEAIDFTASPQVVTQVMEAADKLHQFTAPRLESKDKVAYTGDKTLAFDDGARHGSQTFNFTTVPAAAALVDLMQRIAATGEHALVLRRTMRYERLGVLDQVHQIQDDWRTGLLAEPQLLTPVLDQLAADPALMGSARSQAGELAAAAMRSARPRH